MTDLPELIETRAVTAWNDEVDVVVVGFGISGACAALEAARAGARVLLLERAAEYGGTSAMAGGHFYLGGGTAVQQATGVEDSPEEMFAYLMAVSRDPEEDKIRAFCEDSVEHFESFVAAPEHGEISRLRWLAVSRMDAIATRLAAPASIFPAAGDQS